MIRYLRMVRAWACFHLYLWWPLRWLMSRPAMALLPQAGLWANAEAIRATGDDPWGPPVVISEDEQRQRAAKAHADICAALDKAVQP